MTVNWDTYIRSKDNCNDNIYFLDDFQASELQVEQLNDNLWVVHNYKVNKDNYCWLEFAFFEFNSSDGDGSNIELTMMMNGNGPVGSLKECRHTYWGKEGYMFYPNRTHINAALKWLSAYYDME